MTKNWLFRTAFAPKRLLCQFPLENSKLSMVIHIGRWWLIISAKSKGKMVWTVACDIEKSSLRPLMSSRQALPIMKKIIEQVMETFAMTNLLRYQMSFVGWNKRPI